MLEERVLGGGWVGRRVEGSVGDDTNGDRA